MESLQILDYRPSLQHHFPALVRPWLLNVVNGGLEAEDEESIAHPEAVYLPAGGFVFFAMDRGQCLGTVALKRLDEHRFEFAKLFISPDARKLGLATRLIEKCISRSRENAAAELWLQTTMSMPEAHKLYDKLGFKDAPAPACMDVLARTEKIMVLSL